MKLKLKLKLIKTAKTIGLSNLSKSPLIAQIKTAKTIGLSNLSKSPLIAQKNSGLSLFGP